MSGVALRRGLHMASAGVLLLAPVVGWKAFPFAVTVGGVIALATEALRLKRPRVRDFFAQLLPVFRVAEDARPSGAAWLVLAYVVAAWFPPPVVVAAILVAAFADPAASLAGTVLARRARDGGKTLSGSAAFLLVAVTILLILGVRWPVAVGVASLGAAVERWAGRLDDNLLVAPVTAVALLLLG